jgi:hypothetical protein
MIGVNYWAVVVAGAAAFVAAAVWYVVFSKQRAQLSDAAASQTRPSAWKMLVELGRTLVLVVVLTGLVAPLGIADWTGAVRLAVALWIGFPIILLSGSVMYENVPWKLAAIHAGDWLVKLLIITVILGIWPR